MSLCARHEVAINSKEVLQTVNKINELSHKTQALTSSLYSTIADLRESTRDFPLETGITDVVGAMEALQTSLDVALCPRPACNLSPTGMCSCCVMDEQDIVLQLTATQARVQSTLADARRGGFIEFSQKITDLHSLCGKILQLMMDQKAQQNHSVAVQILIKVAGELAEKVMEPEDPQSRTVLRSLVNELRALRLQIGVDEFADHLQLVANVSRGADSHGVHAMQAMRSNLDQMGRTAHEARDVVRSTYNGWPSCLVQPAAQLQVVEQRSDELVRALVSQATVSKFDAIFTALIRLDSDSLEDSFKEVLRFCYVLDQLQEYSEMLLGTTSFKLSSTDTKDESAVIVESASSPMSSAPVDGRPRSCFC
eukprot:TRINITY_DN23511_c0_g1_i5.p1 TRINITY_DN23511_c0_g1~~TRINITY_DN23511_c0_g1_i5.p1  ORF type:complete len:367 (-),score=90.53 TRINITY_DN23511_c0_g1_i5:71-1171(-)